MSTHNTRDGRVPEPRRQPPSPTVRGAVRVIQHVAAEPPGLLGKVLAEEGWDLDSVRVYRGEPVPAQIGSHRGLVVLGGPMATYEAERYPFLETEQRLIDDALGHGRPVLGICLGSQLLAAALGATVVPNYRREIGWHLVHFTKSAAKDPLWNGQSEDLITFHWHGDRFDVPREAVSLAWSSLTDCQAFRWGRSAYGLLFHLEVDAPAVGRMTRSLSAELYSTGQRLDDLLALAPSHLPALERVGREVFRRWARLMEEG